MFKKIMHFTCLVVLLSSFCLPMQALANAVSKNVHVQSQYDFETVHEKALAFLKEHKLTVFAEFNHYKNAKDVKLSLPQTTVIVFGNPVVGTKLMQKFPDIAMDLPLKVLISEDANGKAIFTYPNLAELFAQHQVPKDNPIIIKMQALLEKLAAEATK